MRLKGYLVAFLAAAVVAMAFGQAYAIWEEIRLTPKTAISDRISFTVKTKDVEGLKQFGVVVEAKKRNISPVLTARLHVVDGQTQIASIPVEGTRADGKVTYWFRVAPRLIANSKFEFGEHGYGRCEDEQGYSITDEWGRPKYIGVPGGSGYWFYLRDFAKGTETTKVSRKVTSFRGVFKLNTGIPVNLDCPTVKDIWGNNQKPFKVETIEFTERDKHLQCLVKMSGQTAAEGKFMVRVKIYSGGSHDSPSETIVALRGFLFETNCVVPTIPLLISEQENLEFGPVHKFKDAVSFEVEIEDVAARVEPGKQRPDVTSFRAAFNKGKPIPVNLACPLIKDVWGKNQRPFRVETIEFIERDECLHCSIKIDGATSADGKFIVRVKIYGRESRDSERKALLAVREFLFETNCVYDYIPLIISDAQNLDFGHIDRFATAISFEIEIENIGYTITATAQGEGADSEVF